MGAAVGGRQPTLGASCLTKGTGGSGCPQGSPTALPALLAHGNFPEQAGKIPGHAQQSQASVTHSAAVRGVKQRETQDWDAGYLGSLPASAFALAAGEEPQLCPLRASVYPVLRGETSDGGFAPHRVWGGGVFFPSEGSKALKYCLSSVPIHPPKRGYTAFAVAQFPQNGTMPESGSGPAGQAHPWEPHTPLSQPPAPLWVQAPPSCWVSPFHPAGFGD